MPRIASTRLRRAALTLLGVTALLLTAPVTANAGGHDHGKPPSDRGCSLTRSTITSTATVDTARAARFTAYGNSGGADGAGWSGGDSTYSAAISGGRLAWVFSDTFLGPVAADGSRPITSPFINNSIVVERHGRLTTVKGGTAQDPQALVPPPDADSWYWFGSALASRSGNTLDVIALKFRKFGPGIFDFGWDSNYLVRFDTRTWKRTAVLPLPSSSNVQWSAWTQRQGRDVLVYGVEDLGAEKYLHLAKVVGGDLARTTSWRYWTGTGWSTQETASTRILSHVANEMSVTRYRDGYLAVTQDTTVAFDPTVRGYVSCSPQGPFTDIGPLYTMPETGPSGSYGDPNVFAYNAHEHPELRRGDTLYVTYNVNSFDNQSLYSDASIYRPRFVRIHLQVRPGS